MGHEGTIKELKDYILIEGELYRRLPKGILSRCISEKEGRLRLEELYSHVCLIVEKISLYRKDAAYGVLLAKYEQRGCNCIGGMSKVLAFSGQRRKLCCVCDRRLENPIHGILGSRDPVN